MVIEPPEEEQAFPDKWVRILCDSCADGVWNILGEGCTADGLPITAGLVARIRAWQSDYDARIDMRDDVTDPEIEAFATEGLEIARDSKSRAK